jgi:acetyltransferase-like isoleucine patch superfamily enzyme
MMLNEVEGLWHKRVGGTLPAEVFARPGVELPGDGATIGPLTVVGCNLQPRVLVTGNPMRIVRRDYGNSAEINGPNE